MTIKDFIEKKIAVAIETPEQAIKFAEMIAPYDMRVACEKKKAHEWIKEKAKEKFNGYGKYPISFSYNFVEVKSVFENALGWCELDSMTDPHYIEKGWKIVPFEEFVEKTKRYFSKEKCVKTLSKAHIESAKRTKERFGINPLGWMDECDGAEMIEGGWMIAPDGCKYACNEKWTVEKKPEIESAYKIEITYDGEKVTTARMTVNGKVVKEATARRNPEDKFDFKKGASLAFDRLFERKKEFKVGDRVVCVSKDDDNDKNVVGKHGVVINGRPYHEGFISVQFEKKLHNGHSCGGVGKEGYCRWIHENSLKHE